MAAAKTKPDTPNNRLLRSSEKGDLAGAETALQNGADLHASDDGQNTCLHLASYRGHSKLVGWLLSSGADATRGNENQDLPLHLAALANRLPVVQILLSPSAQSKSNLEAADAQGYRPLHYACGEGHTEVAEYLVKEAGAKTESRNMDGLTPLMCSVQQGHRAIAKMLLEFEPACIDQVNNCNDTSLHYAMISDAGIPMIELLLRSGADPDKKNAEGHTPLVEAVIEKKTESAEFLTRIINQLCHYPGYAEFRTASQRAAAVVAILDGSWQPPSEVMVSKPAAAAAASVPAVGREGHGGRAKLKFSSARAGIRTKTSIETAREEFAAATEAPKPKNKSRIFTPGSSNFNF
mmetsp:Transcript_21977/g.51101  ORF Transcript_21977/g.51101 Transcript_21977/m.51101 type:complete len:350 (-) Transcript_21977:1318-2367(-)